MSVIDERFPYFSTVDGQRFQVLRLALDDATGEMAPVDWDEAASAQKMNEHLAERPSSKENP